MSSAMARPQPGIRFNAYLPADAAAAALLGAPR
jgi:hypothetical protein